MHLQLVTLVMSGAWRSPWTGYLKSFGKHTSTLRDISIASQALGASAAPKSIQTYELYHNSGGICNEKFSNCVNFCCNAVLFFGFGHRRTNSERFVRRISAFLHPFLHLSLRFASILPSNPVSAAGRNSISPASACAWGSRK